MRPGHAAARAAGGDSAIEVGTARGPGYRSDGSSHAPFTVPDGKAVPMVAHYMHRPRPAPVTFWDGTSARVAGYDGAVLATISRRTGTGSGPGRSEAIISVDGDLDQDTAPLLRAVLVQELAHWPRVCCDMTGVDFLGAAGVTTLLAAHRRAGELGHAFSVRGVHGVAEHVLVIAGPGGMVAGRGQPGSAGGGPVPAPVPPGRVTSPFCGRPRTGAG